MSEENKYIAISQADFDQYGCPHCGGKIHNEKNGAFASWMGTSDFWCKECNKRSAILKEGLTTSTIGFSAGDEPVYYPKQEDHPLKQKI